jgi:hypothetical protein
MRQKQIMQQIMITIKIIVIHLEVNLEDSLEEEGVIKEVVIVAGVEEIEIKKLIYNFKFIKKK